MRVLVGSNYQLHIPRLSAGTGSALLSRKWIQVPDTPRQHQTGSNRLMNLPVVRPPWKRMQQPQAQLIPMSMSAARVMARLLGMQPLRRLHQRSEVLALRHCSTRRRSSTQSGQWKRPAAPLLFVRQPAGRQRCKVEV